MTLKELTENWKCIGALVVTAGLLCGAALGVDDRYAKSQDLKQLQRSTNYSNFQMRLSSLRKLCSQNMCDQNDKNTIKWLEAQIKLIEKEMGISDGTS